MPFETVKQVVDSAKQYLSERLNNPILGGLAFIWVIWNWDIVSIFLFSDSSIETKIGLIKSDYYNVKDLFWTPFIIACVYGLVWPYIDIAASEVRSYAFRVKAKRDRLSLLKIEISNLGEALISAKRSLSLQLDRINSEQAKADQQDRELAEVEEKKKELKRIIEKLERDEERKAQQIAKLSEYDAELKALAESINETKKSTPGVEALAELEEELARLKSENPDLAIDDRTMESLKTYKAENPDLPINLDTVKYFKQWSEIMRESQRLFEDPVASPKQETRSEDSKDQPPEAPEQVVANYAGIVYYSTDPNIERLPLKHLLPFVVSSDKTDSEKKELVRNRKRNSMAQVKKAMQRAYKVDHLAAIFERWNECDLGTILALHDHGILRNHLLYLALVLEIDPQLIGTLVVKYRLLFEEIVFIKSKGIELDEAIDDLKTLSFEELLQLNKLEYPDWLRKLREKGTENS